MEKLLISACLLGEEVRYDGRANTISSQIINKWVKEKRLIPVCPEVAGGLSIPRPPAEIQSGDGYDVLAGKSRVVTIEHGDVTGAYLSGARQVYRLAMDLNIKIAILTSESPSCGCGEIYDGTFTGALHPGDGVTTALLKNAGIRVFTEREIDQAEIYLRQLEGKNDPGTTN